MVNGVDETLQRTPGSTGNDNTWTISLWFKRSKLDADQRLFTCFSADALKQVSLGFDSSNRMSFMTYDGGFQLKLLTTRTFGDTSQWVHVVAFYDDTVTTPGSSDCGLYINGVQETVLTTSDYPSQNDGTTMNLGNLHWIGASSESSGSTFYSGYYADFYIIDGTKQAASDFGEVDSTTNRWIPKDATGLTFGTNGVYLDYADKNDLGDDESGNGNDFTEVNIDTTNGSNQFHDTPTRNFLTGDTSQKGSGVTVSNGGLTSTADGSGSEGIRATNLSESTVRLQSGKWYFEYLIDVIDAVQAQPNLMPFIWEEADLTDTSLTSAELGNHIEFSQFSNMRARIEGVNYDYNDFFTDLAVGDVVSFAIDADNDKIYVALNDSWSSLTGDPDASGAGISYPFSSYRGTYGCVKHFGGSKSTMNYGQWEYFDGTTLTETADAKGYFRFTPPEGYLALNNDNLTETDSFQTAFSWTKNRDAADGHRLLDRVRGRYDYLSSDATTAETTDTNTLQRFLKQGQLIGNADAMNTSMESFVSWDWFIESTGAGTTLDAGSIDSVCLADTTGGFSVFTTTLGASASTVYTAAHGLSAVPKFWIAKDVTNGSGPYNCYHVGLTSPPEDRNIKLNVALGEEDNDLVWGGTAPTSSLISFSTGSWGTSVGLIVWAWAEIEGFSAFGSYTGNGLADGPMIFTGMTPTWILIKNTSRAGREWELYDNKRDPLNPNTESLYPDQTNAESTLGAIDFLSNGFKMRSTDTLQNQDGDTMIYVAFASNPFGGASTTPATAF